MHTTSSIGRALIVAALVLFVPLLSHAAEFRAAEQPSLSSGETAAGNLYMAGGTVTSAGVVRGDLVIAGGTLLDTSSVSGDVLAAGGTVNILGNVQGDVRAAGGTLVVSGTVGGDVVVAGGQVEVMGQRVGGDVAIAGGTVTIDSAVAGNARIAGGAVYINAPVVGNVDIRADSVKLGPKAVIDGDLTYTAKQQATLETGAVVRGATHYSQASTTAAVSQAGIAAMFSIWLLLHFLMLLVGAFVFALLFKRYASSIVESVVEAPFLEIGRGFVVLVVGPAAAIVLFITVIGIPLGVLTLTAYAVVLMLSWLIAPVVLGSILYKWIAKKEKGEVTWREVLLGVVIFFLVGFIPFVGWLVDFIFVLLTLGAAAKFEWNIVKEWR